MNENELFYLLALQKVEGVGDIIAKKLLNHCGNAKTIFNAKASQLNSIDGIGSVLIQKLKDKTVFEKAEAELKFIKNNSIQTAFFQDENYPDKLKHCIDGPVLLVHFRKYRFKKPENNKHRRNKANHLLWY